LREHVPLPPDVVYPLRAKGHYSVWTLLCPRIESCGVRTRTTLQKLGDEVRERRLKRSLTQEALADAAGVHVNALKKLERGKTNSQVLTLFGIAVGLKTPLAELIAGVERRP
jgi:DNA-binding XRE family transcriptional regulator